MKITDIRTMKLTGPDSHGVGGKARNVSYLLVRVDTDEGIYGIGESEVFLGVPDSINYIKDTLIGRDPMNIRSMVSEILYGRMPPLEPSMSPTATHLPVIWGISGIEMALCDIAGKVLDTPVYNLLGGKYRDQILIYVDRSSPSLIDDLDQWKLLAENCIKEGYTHIKFDLDYTAPDPNGDPWNRSISAKQLNQIVERISTVREEVGWDVEIALDCHWHYDIPSAIRITNELAHLKPFWLEDPTPLTDPDGLAEVKEKSPIPICIGEMFTAEQFKLFINRRACDIIHPDVLFTGGIHETRKIADYANLNYMPIAIHNNGGIVATIAAGHVAAASSNFIGLECHFQGSPWVKKLVKDNVGNIENGYLTLRENPGLGIELDTDVCKKYVADGETFIF